jgi:hypothetical protein
MSVHDAETLFEFPCEYPVKAMGSDVGNLEDLVVTLVSKHCSEIIHIKSRPSKQGNFIAVTVTITASSKQQLDNIYYELSSHEKIMMAL